MNKQTSDKPPNCWECQHLGVTWETVFPYLCKQMGFKSARLPSQEVLAADGHPCRAFSSKTTVPKIPRERSDFRK
ncbi:MAG: uracil-DNA glycosylase [Gammaproteobacteria bacterium]|nr:uracil-DNA glycosylase [Gammaproteobacteria bacterium]